MKYQNPVLNQDFSDPDVIRVGEDFYMVASSFNFCPGIPILHSKNLVEWELINYVLPALPFPKFDKVCHGEGVWAVSLRYNKGKFYCLIPFPDEGIFVSETSDIYGEWSPIRPILLGKGYEDPCPIWDKGKCYVVFGFIKSRIGFNSRLAILETDEELLAPAKTYKFIFDGHDMCPTIEGPKIFKRGIYYYISAPCGSVKSGWQVMLRSRKIYGEYESKIVLMQGDSPINGPHQGAIIDLDDKGTRWAFMHFQDRGAYGRVVHLQPAEWIDDWCILGKHNSDGLCGTPILEGEYPVDIQTEYRIDGSDDFTLGKLNMNFQTPANMQDGWYYFKRGLVLPCIYTGANELHLTPNVFTQKVMYNNFAVSTKCKLDLVNDGDEVGFCVLGRAYTYVCIVRKDGENFLEIRGGKHGEREMLLARSQPYTDNDVLFKLSAKMSESGRLTYQYSVSGTRFSHTYTAESGVWVGARVGIYAKAMSENEHLGSAKFKEFRVTCTDARF